MGMTVAQSQKLASLVKEIQLDCLINGRIGHGLGDYLTMADNRIPREALKSAWEVPVTLNQSWGYKRLDDNWVKAPETFEKLVKIISRGGNMLLNIGPRGDGSVYNRNLLLIFEKPQRRLLLIWLCRHETLWHPY